MAEDVVTRLQQEAAADAEKDLGAAIGLHNNGWCKNLQKTFKIHRKMMTKPRKYGDFHGKLWKNHLSDCFSWSRELQELQDTFFFPKYVVAQ
jgi:hypothetical protein